LKLYVFLRKIFKSLYNFFYSLELSESRKKTQLLLKEEIDRYVSNKKEFLKYPLQLSKKSKYNQYEHSIYLYVILKQLIALFESEQEALPIQVYNEIRNAYDHFSRGLISEKKDSDSHIKKQEGHLQRAILDICKLTCNFYQERITSVHRKYPKKSFSLISNGEYIKEFIRREEKSRALLILAKENDINLTDVHKKNEIILNNYITALISYKELAKFQTSHLQNFVYISIKYFLIRGASAFAVALISFITGILATVYGENIISYVRGLFN